MTTSAFLHFLNFVLIAIEVSMIALLADGFFTKKTSSHILLCTLIALILLSNLNAYFMDTFPVLRMVLTTLLYSLWIGYNYQSGIAKSCFSSVFLVSFQVIIDSVFLIIATALSNKMHVEILSSPYAYYLVCYSAKLLVVFSVVTLRTWSKKRFDTQVSPWTDWLRILFFPLSTFLISLYLISILFSEPTLAPKLLACTFILLFSDLMAILLLDHLERQQTAILDNTVLKQNLKLETEHIQALQESYANQRRLTHDFENQLAVLRSMAEREATQKEFTQYLNRILSLEFPSVSYVNTHRAVVDVILNQKCTLAQSKGIDFQQKLDDLSSFPLPDDALVIVLTNLIDNAIEACEKIPAPAPRSILLKMQVTPKCAYLYIENTTASPVQIRDNQISTTKEDTLSHGYGLKNVYTMLDRHHALYAIDYVDDTHTFRFSIRLGSEL